MPDGWVEYPVYRNGQKVAFFMVKGNEIHCARSESYKGRWLTRQDIERIAKPIFEKYGYVTTKVRNNNQTGHRFVTRLGYVKVFEDENETHYRGERAKHAR